MVHDTGTGKVYGFGVHGLTKAKEMLEPELTTLAAELAGEPDAGRCYAATAVPRKGRWALSAMPVDVSAFVSREFAAQKRALVLASATLSTGPETPYVLKRLGLSYQKARPRHPQSSPAAQAAFKKGAWRAAHRHRRDASASRDPALV